MRWHDIPDAQNPKVVYLRRLRVIATPWFGIFVHWIYLPDADTDPHDHPWNFRSTVLRGGYTEEVFAPDMSSEVLIHERWSSHKMPTTDAHMIQSIQPETVTLILVGKRDRDWGFWTSDGWVNWKTYIEDKYSL